LVIEGLEFAGSAVKAPSLVGQLTGKATQNFNTRLNRTLAIAAQQCTGKMEADKEEIEASSKCTGCPAEPQPDPLYSSLLAPQLSHNTRY
jgi:nitrogen fixation protein FixH